MDTISMQGLTRDQQSQKLSPMMANLLQLGDGAVLIRTSSKGLGIRSPAVLVSFGPRVSRRRSIVAKPEALSFWEH